MTTAIFTALLLGQLTGLALMLALWLIVSFLARLIRCVIRSLRPAIPLHADCFQPTIFCDYARWTGLRISHGRKDNP